jgi:hypothetical protein
MPTRATRDQSKATGSSPSPAGTVLPPAQQIHADLTTLAEAAATVEESSSSGAVRTRSGRVSKAPVRYEPVEQVEDDYAPEDYDTEDSGDSSEDIETDEDEEDDESDADDDGNLDGFVVPDKSESDVSDSDEDGEPAVPVAKRRAVVKKRPTAAAARA